jgi:PST family polysaccharide transporter
MIYPLVRKLSGFFWSATNVKAGLILLASIAVVFLALQALPVEWAIAAGVLAIVASSIYSIRMLVALAPRDCLPERLWRLLELIPVASAHRK